MPAARKKLSGGASMAATGKRPVQVWFTPAEMEELQLAAKIDGRPMTQFLAHYGLTQVRKIIRKSSSSG